MNHSRLIVTDHPSSICGLEWLGLGLAETETVREEKLLGFSLGRVEASLAMLRPISQRNAVKLSAGSTKNQSDTAACPLQTDQTWRRDQPSEPSGSQNS